MLDIIKNQPHLFDGQVDSSEWDFVVKFWSVITERLFLDTDFHLKRKDTHPNIISNLLLKVALRVLHDRVRQRFNVETDDRVFEDAEEEHGDVKYVSDRYKVMIENKAVIDRFNSIEYIQVYGLQIDIVNIIPVKTQ